MTSHDPSPRTESSGWSRGELVVLAIACLLPTFVTLLYFHWASGTPSGTQQLIYAIAKGVQFALPVAWVAWVEREALRWPRWGWSGVGAGLILGLLIGGAMWGLYLLLAESSVMRQATVPIQQKISDLGIDSLWRFAALGGFYSLVHSLLEEYYWRWFVFGRLRKGAALGVAIALSSIAFALHHVVVLWHYFFHAPAIAILFSAGVAVGGAIWAGLYHHSRSLLGPWLSHLLVDAAIFTIGIHLAWPLITAG